MTDRPILRLSLQGFAPAEATILRELIEAADVGWVLVDEGPVHAMLLARGSREGDPEHSAVLRVNLGARPAERANERRMDPLLLRKPIRAATLRVALQVARTRREVHGQTEDA